MAGMEDFLDEIDSEYEVGNVKTKKLRPLGDRVLVRVKALAQETIVNGLVRPDITVEKPQEGVVVAVGKGKIVNGERIPMDVEVGDEILFGRYSGNEVSVSGETLLLINENELMGCFEF